MRAAPAILVATVTVLCVSRADAQDASIDERTQRAVQLFQKRDFVAAATMFEEIERDANDPFMTLNSMVAWYEARRCNEALAAYDRVDRGAAFEASDLADLDRVHSYCMLEKAQALAAVGDLAGAKAIVDGLAPRDATIRARRDALRDEIILQQQAGTAPTEEVVQPAPQPEPERDRRVLYAGYGFLATGVGLGVATLVKHFAFDQPALRDGRNEFAAAYRCPDGLWTSCSDAQRAQITSDGGYVEWDAGSITRARTASLAMGLSAGVLALTGGGLLAYHFLSTPDAQPGPTATLAPMVGPGQHGVSLQIEF